MHVDEKDDLTWTCEAFGIPDVKYAWMKNSVAISGPDMAVEDRDRYEIRDNVLIIRNVRKDRDQGMYQCKSYNELDTRYSSGQLTFSLCPIICQKSCGGINLCSRKRKCYFAM